jgi:geranylgeranyl pyrophosphate synthase
MSESFKHFQSTSQQRVNAALAGALADQIATGTAHYDVSLTRKLHEAMRYCLLNGGKRVRATLVYAAAEACGAHAPPAALDQIAVSMECLHAYSLIHDDLPAMDDDDLRRGMPSCHKAYDEATAILAGDALHSLSFELMADCPQLPAIQRLALVSTLATAAGAAGMVGGQHIDLSIDRDCAELAQLETLHSLKTGALIRAAIKLGAIASDADSEQISALDHYAQHIGLAFQVKDDLLDVEGSTAALGKRQGSDIVNNKMTYPSLLGIEGSRQHLAALHQQALTSTVSLGGKAEHLRHLANYIVERNH